LLALDAYYRAAVEASQSLRRCAIQWWAIAAITRTESHHGTYGGARLLGNGDTDPHIIGITLDGTNDTAVIPDTDGGKFDGDPDYDHAVGPMQFIPSTWKRWQADGNGDGVADPNNIYDAAEAAAHYLCATGPMESDDDLLRGYFSYNHSDDYAQAVLANSQLYRQYAIPPVPSGA
jgi:membrane-bound lytic murein transglycosylase B